MNFFNTNFDKRINPSLLLDGAKSIIVAAINYKPPTLTQNVSPQYPSGQIASFAQYEDYHTFIENNLWKLADFITFSSPAKIINSKSASILLPLAEKALAARAGLGFIGKNHLLINPQLGPQLLLGEIITTVALEPDNPITSQIAEIAINVSTPAQLVLCVPTASSMQTNVSATLQ